MSSKRILLVDGNSIMNRAFFAVFGRAPMTAPDGTPTGALNGFFNTLLSVKDEYQPTDICVLFDLKAPTFRHKLSADYKAQRKGMLPELSVQMPIVKELLDLMGISRMELEGYEADDLIGTLSRLGEEAGDEVFILSGDHDDYQLISDKVSVIMPQSGKDKPPRVLVDREYFENMYGVKPEVFVYVKALMGDNSDNIKGVEKVGEKTAFKLISDYGDLEGVKANADKLSPALSARINASHDLLDLNLKLCTIDRNVPVPYGLDETSWSEIKDRQGMHDRLANLGLKMLTKKLSLDDLKTSAPSIEDLVNSSDSEEDNLRIKYFGEFNDVQDKVFVTRNVPTINDEDVVAVDFDGDMAIVSLNDSPEVFVFDANSLGEIIASKNVKVIAFDYKEKSKVMDNALDVDSIFDTGIAGYVMNFMSGNKPDFVRLIESLFKVGYPIDEEDLGPKQLDLTSELFGAPEDSDDKKYFILGKRVILNKFAAKLIADILRITNKEKLLYEIEFPLVVTLDAIERNGMYVSGDKLKELHREFSEKLKELEGEIYKAADYEFNINSPKQLSEVLFERLNLPHGKKGKTGVYSTSIDELNRLRDFHPVIDMIITYRGLSKLDSTYANGLLDKICDDSRIRTTFTQAMTNTGRLSSTEPNLQNIPVRSHEGGRIRECFTVPEGRILVDADYSQIELRLLAAMSGDKVMTDAFIEGADIHRRTASKVFGVSEEEVTHEQRAVAKTVNFSIVYGVSEFGLSTDLDISFREAGDLIKEYGAQFPSINKFLDGLKAAGEKLGYVETLFGRRRILTELSSPNRNIKNFGYRAAMNTPVQGTAADIIKIAMNKVYRALKAEVPSSKLVMQVHDELIVECEVNDKDLVASVLRREMESAIKLSVPLVAEANSGYNWLEAK